MKDESMQVLYMIKSIIDCGAGGGILYFTNDSQVI